MRISYETKMVQEQLVKAGLIKGSGVISCFCLSFSLIFDLKTQFPDSNFLPSENHLAEKKMPEGVNIGLLVLDSFYCLLLKG